MKKWWAKLLAVLALLLVVLCAIFLTSSVHNKSDLEKYKDQLRAAGEKLNVTDLAPPVPPPEKNGADLFMTAARYINSSAGALESNEPPMMRMVAPGKAMIGWQQPKVIAPQGNQAITNSWDDIDQAMQAQGQAFDLLRQAAERPQLNFDLDYTRFPNYLPVQRLTKIRGAALILSAATGCDLHRGDTASAVTNLDTLLKLVNHWQDEPILITQLIRIAMESIASTAQWELLQATNVTDQQLKMLQGDWDAANFARPMENALAMERDGDMLLIESLRNTNSSSPWFSTGGGGGSAAGPLDQLKQMAQSAGQHAAYSLWRVSWAYDDELSVLRGQQAMVDSLRVVGTDGYFKDALADLDRKIAALGTNAVNNTWLRRILDDQTLALFMDLTGSLSKCLQRTMAIEVTRSIVITAIALKRYELRHGSLPPDLKALVPEFLPSVPRDPVDGKPLRYKPNPDGTYLLYSVGSDGKDDGGATTSPGTRSLLWQRGADWVWPQPATAAEVQKYYGDLIK